MALHKSRNTTNTSWWMVQIQSKKDRPTIRRAKRAGGMACQFLLVSGILKRFPLSSGALRAEYFEQALCRMDLNHPPTGVGGIQTFCAKPSSGVKNARVLFNIQ